MAIFVIDNARLLPTGSSFQSRVLNQEQAAAELKRDKYWEWCFENKTGEKFELLPVLSRESGRTLDLGHRFEDHEVLDPRRLSMKTGAEFLLILDDLTYKFFTPVGSQPL